MRIVFFAAVMALAPDALAQRCCNCGNATAAIEGIAASVQLSVTSVQLSVALAQAKARAGCSTDDDCSAQYRCSANQCVQREGSAAATQRDQTLEIFLRQRVVELREELALGRGPVIQGLAAAQGVPDRALGPVLRAHRAELVALMGDGSDPAWSARFLARVEALKQT